MKLRNVLPLALLLSCQPQANISGDAEIATATMKAPPPDAGAETATEAGPIIDSGDFGTWSLHFSPNGGCEEAIVAFIGTAKGSVHMLAYGFTEIAVANALIAKKAQGHGMDIEVVLDRSDKTAKGSMAPILKNGNVETLIDSKHAIAHNKVIIVDGVSFETGSYNFTNAAEKSNAENCLIENDPMKARAYEANFQLHKAHSEPFPYTN